MTRTRSGVCAALIGAVLFYAGCSRADGTRATVLEPVPGEARGAGALVVPVGVHASGDLMISLSGLEPGEAYVLCLNAMHPATETSATLGTLGVPGWPLGAFVEEPDGRRKGFWDFAKVQADASGRYRGAFTLPLPAMDYRVMLLVKDVPGRGSGSFLQSEALMLSVDPLLGAKRLGSGIAAAVSLLVLTTLVVRRRLGPQRAPAGSLPPLPRGAPMPAVSDDADVAAPEASSRSDAEDFACSTAKLACDDSSRDVESRVEYDSAGASGTLVERARCAGTFVHHKDFAWVEIQGRRKTFRPRQALVFRILCEQDPECYGIPQEQIVKEWEAVYQAKRANPVRVLDIFRSREDEPGDFVERVPGSASVYRLKLDDPGEAGVEVEDRPRVAMA